MNQILSTKLYAPPIRQDIVQRHRLLKLLDEGIHRKLTLLSAPAGFGKTTLASAWARQTGRSIAWISLDENDSDLQRFLTYLIAALRTIHLERSNFGSKAEELLYSVQPPPIDLIITEVINEIAASSQPMILVLDDFHVVDHPQIDAALQFLIQHQPSQLHIVLTTREDPQLPLARLRARGQLNELRVADIRFSFEEAAAFLNEIMNLGLTSENVRALENRTEGWITGLQLAGIALSGTNDATGFIRDFSGRHRFILSYLIEEVLDQQTEDVQQFLLKTSLLARLNGPLCTALTGHINGQSMLNDLEAANLFLIPLDGEQKWFRYHHLFADLLRQRLEAKYPDSVPQLHIQASIWHEENDLPLEAFRHAAAANDIERTERLAAGAGMPLYYRGGMVPVMQWLSSLPAEVLDKKPALRLMYASALTMAGEPVEHIEDVLRAAELSLTTADSNQRENEHRDFIGRIASIRAMLAVPQNDIESVIQQSKTALEYLDPRNMSDRIAMAWTLGYAYQRRGDRGAAKNAFTEAISVSEAAGNTMIAIGSHTSLAQVLESDNQPQQAEKHYRKAIELAGEPPLPVSCEAHIGIARIYYEWNRLVEARQHAETSAALAQQMRNLDTPITIAIAKARIDAAEGNTASAEQSLSEAEDFARQHAFNHRLPEIAAARMRIMLAAGSPIANTQTRFEDLSPELRARFYLVQGLPDQAHSILARSLEELEEKEWAFELLRARLLMAVIEDARHQAEASRTLLEKSMDMAQPTGFIRLFVDEGPAMARLVAQIANTKPSEHTRRILSAFGSVTAAPPTLSALPEALSDREIEVLRMLNSNLTGPEIARELVVSLNTLRTHTKNIFRKLDVSSRRAAVRKGVDLGFL